MKNVKKLFTAILFAFALLMVMPAVLPGYSNTVDVNAAVTQKTLFKGYKSDKFSVTIKNATNLTWASSNTKVATVTSTNSGTKITVTPKASGTAYISYKTAGSSSYTKMYLINVVTINPSSIFRSKNGSYTLKLNGNTSGLDIGWSVTTSTGASTSVATLSNKTTSSVKVTAKKAGTAYVRVSINGTKRFATKIKVEELYLSKSSIGLTKGNTYTLKVKDKSTSAATSRTVTWSSSDTSIAKVSSAGKVTAVKKGTAYIYATVGGVRYKCKVSVSNPLTAADYMDKLKTTITTKGKIYSDGNPYIYRAVTNDDGTAKYYYYVIYDKSNDRLRFIFKRKDTASDSKRSATISMYIYNPSKSYKTTPSLTITTKTGISFKTKRTFDYRTYSNSTDYTFSITNWNVTLTANRKAAMQSLSNDYLQMAMKGWNTLLKKYDSSLTLIGFAKY